MAFYWKMKNNETGELVENDYPFASKRGCKVSAKRYARRRGWADVSVSISDKPHIGSRQYKLNPCWESGRRCIINRSAPRIEREEINENEDS